MIKKVIDSLKQALGFKGKMQIDFDDAMLSIFKAAADSKHFLAVGDSGQDDAGGGAKLSHEWSEAAIKINRLNDELREDCLALAKAFAETNSLDAEKMGAALDRVDAIFTKSGKFLGDGGKLIK
jgi:hypothetical protein